MEGKIRNFCMAINLSALHMLIEIIDECLNEYPEYTDEEIRYVLGELKSNAKEIGYKMSKSKLSSVYGMVVRLKGE